VVVVVRSEVVVGELESLVEPQAQRVPAQRRSGTSLAITAAVSQGGPHSREESTALAPAGTRHLSFGA
jgi:hypothetical protein